MSPFARDQLATLLMLVDEGTFERAAARMHVTASAVSQRVKAMEVGAGQILVERTNPVRPTAAGDIVLRLARQVQLVESDALAELARAGFTGPAVRDAAGAPARASISVAVNADSLATWFLAALAVASEQLPAVFDVHRDDQAHTPSLLRSGAVMAAVTSAPEPVQGCSAVPLGAMRYRAVASPAFVRRWREAGDSAHQGEALEWLTAAPHVDFDRKDDLQLGFLRRRGMDARSAARHYLPTSADFARAIVLGLGWGMLPEQQCLDDIASGALVELAADEPFDVPLHWQRWNLRSPLLDGLTAAVRSAAAGALRPLPPSSS